MEYLLVVGFSLILIIPVVTLLYSEYQENQEGLRLDHLSELSRELIYQAEKIYYQGAPSRTTIEAYIPEGVSAVQIEQQTGSSGTVSSIHFVLEDGSTTPYVDSNIAIQGDIDSYSGAHTLILEAIDLDDFDPTNDYVNIRDG